MFDSNKFKERIMEMGFTVGKVASFIGINEATLYRKISGSSEFSRAEIQLIRNVLKLTVAEAEEIFFAEKLA